MHHSGIVTVALSPVGDEKEKIVVVNNISHILLMFPEIYETGNFLF